MGLGIEEAVEREAGRARRGQDRAKIAPFFRRGPKIGPKVGYHPGDPVHFGKSV